MALTRISVVLRSGLVVQLRPKRDLDEQRNLVSRMVEHIRDSNDLIEITKKPGADYG